MPYKEHPEKHPGINVYVNGVDMTKGKMKEWHYKRRFPTFSVILLILSGLWLLNAFNVISTPIPWAPLILFGLALGWIINYSSRRYF